MRASTMSVFYGTDALPYKDSARTVHFPIVGNSFIGTHNTKKIRFYVDRLGGTNYSWVILSKLPNGKIGYEPLSNVGTDTEINEQYLEFDLSSYYTSVKGDLYLALKGYQGHIDFVEDQWGVLVPVGNPLIEVTGSIKLAINYAPLPNTGTQVLPTDIDRILTALSEYLKIGNGIVVAPNTSIDLDDYNVGQLFFINKDIYIVSETSGTKTLSKLNAYIRNYGTVSSTTLAALYHDLGASSELCTFKYNGTTYLGRVYSPNTNVYTFTFIDVLGTNRYTGTNVSGSTALTSIFSSTYNKPFAEKEYVDSTFATKVYVDSNFVSFIESSDQTLTLADLYDLMSSKKVCIFKYIGMYGGTFMCNIVFYGGTQYSFEIEDLVNKNRWTGSHISGSTTLNTILSTSSIYYKPYATEEYVDNALADFLQREYSEVDITEFPTLDDFLASEGEEGYIYLYPIGNNEGYYQYIWENNAWVLLGTTNIDLSNYVQKTTTANKVYGTNELGTQTTYTVDDFYEGNIARRDTDGSITVPLTPTQNGHASSKKYVDDSVSAKQDELTTTSVVDGTVDKDIGFDSQGNLVKQKTMITLTQAEYDDITPDADTYYFIEEE